MEDTPIPDEDFRQIQARYNRVKPRNAAWVTKRYVYQTLLGPLRFGTERATKKYGENWIQIRWRLTGLKPLPLGRELIDAILSTFNDFVVPAFRQIDRRGRKHILNYNYSIVQLLHMHKADFAIPYFSQIVTGAKLRLLDEFWFEICEKNDWIFTSIFRLNTTPV